MSDCCHFHSTATYSFIGCTVLTQFIIWHQCFRPTFIVLTKYALSLIQYCTVHSMAKYQLQFTCVIEPIVHFCTLLHGSCQKFWFLFHTKTIYKYCMVYLVTTLIILLYVIFIPSQCFYDISPTRV